MDKVLGYLMGIRTDNLLDLWMAHLLDSPRDSPMDSKLDPQLDHE